VFLQFTEASAYLGAEINEKERERDSMNSKYKIRNKFV